MTRAAVWGASGFIGGALCAAAEAKGWSVHRLPRDGADAAALAGVDVAYHCAGKAEETDPRAYVEAAERFARACAAAGVKRLVYLGTVAVYGLKTAGDIGTDAPLEGTGAYAESRISAERALQSALAGGATRLCVVRVPTILGCGMRGTVLARFSRAVGWGLFVHPGPAEATLACLGVRRLAQILVRLGDMPSPPALAQFSDHLRWTAIAERAGAARGRRILRLRIPALGGKLAVLASTAVYRDDTLSLFGETTGLPATAEDLEAALRP
jgi:nucleoside-diphosphate-sugar epimerase